MALIFNLVDENEHLDLGVSKAIYNIRVPVLHQIYNHWPSARVCISDTTLPLMLYILHVVLNMQCCINTGEGCVNMQCFVDNGDSCVNQHWRG